MSDESKITLEMTLRALVIVSLKGLPKDDQVEALSRAGWTNAQISSVTGLKPNAVNMRKARMKGKKGGENSD